MDNVRCSTHSYVLPACRCPDGIALDNILKVFSPEQALAPFYLHYLISTGIHWQVRI